MEVFLLSCCHNYVNTVYVLQISPTTRWTHVLSSTDGQLTCLFDCPKCPQATQCPGTRCFSSINLDSSGVVFKHGCLVGLDNIHLQCSTAPSFRQAIFCCSQDMCNNNNTRSLLMSLLPTGWYKIIPCFILAHPLIVILSSFLISPFVHSPRRGACSVPRGDVGSLCARSGGGAGSAVCGVSSGLQEAPPRPSAEDAGVRQWAGSHRRPHHLQCGRQHFSGEIKTIKRVSLLSKERSR